MSTRHAAAPAFPQKLAGKLGWKLAAFCLALLVLAPPAPAQGLGGLTGSGEGSLDIRAEDGIEWRRDEGVYIARGNAEAVRGDLSVNADRLIARYRDSAGGGSEIHEIEAVGQVRIATPTETAHGKRALFDLDRDVVVLTGGDLRLVTGDETITARDSLEYWAGRRLAVARGNAVARRGERRLAADVLTAHFVSEGAGEGAGQNTDGVERLEAFGSVEIASPTSVARADKGIYTPDTQLMTLSGDVRLTRGSNQLNGGYAEINLGTGVSRLLGAPPNADAKARVQGLLSPRERDLSAPGGERDLTAPAMDNANDGEGDEGGS